MVTAALMNTHVRDDLRYLKGLDGAVTIEDSLIIQTANGKYLQVPSMTTANLPAAPANGMVVYDTTTGTFKRYEAGAWQSYVKAGTGTYTGDGTVNRAIPHGLGLVPKLVTILRGDTAPQLGLIITVARIYYFTSGGVADNLAVTIPDATNFYVGNATDYLRSMNYDTASYQWTAIA